MAKENADLSRDHMPASYRAWERDGKPQGASYSTRGTTAVRAGNGASQRPVIRRTRADLERQLAAAESDTRRQMQRTGAAKNSVRRPNLFGVIDASSPSRGRSVAQLQRELNAAEADARRQSERMPKRPGFGGFVGF